MIDAWARKKNWLVYLPLVLLYAYVVFKLRDFPKWTVPFTDVANLGIHEIGHELFRALGEFMYVAGGTITEVFIPFAFALILIKRGWMFLGLASILWMTTALRGAALYAGDAVKKNLILINIQGEVSSGNGAVGHDWEFLLDKFGLSNSAEGVETFINTVALVIGVAVVLFAAYLVYRAASGVPEKAKVAPHVGPIPATPYNNAKATDKRTVYSSDPIDYRSSK